MNFMCREQQKKPVWGQIKLKIIRNDQSHFNFLHFLVKSIQFWDLVNYFPPMVPVTNLYPIKKELNG